MNSNTKFNDIRIVAHGLVLQNGNRVEREISFSELDKIYIKVNKLTPLHELGFILFPFLLIFLAVQYITFEKVVFLGLSTVVPVFVKINNYKSYGLRVCLKDGTVFRKRVSLGMKDKNVAIVHAVRREQLNHFNGTQQL